MRNGTKSQRRAGTERKKLSAKEEVRQKGAGRQKFVGSIFGVLRQRLNRRRISRQQTLQSKTIFEVESTTFKLKMESFSLAILLQLIEQ